MATFIGFSTINVDQVRKNNVTRGVAGGGGTFNNQITNAKKFTMTDTDLVIRDFLNALNIPLGQKPGRPDYGTTLWDFVFEPNTTDVQTLLENEVRRVGNQDPRISLGVINCTPYNSGIQLEAEFSISPFNDVQSLSVFFDQSTNKALGV